MTNSEEPVIDKFKPYGTCRNFIGDASCALGPQATPEYNCPCLFYDNVPKLTIKDVILDLASDNDRFYPSDIVTKYGYSYESVSEAIKELIEQGFIDEDTPNKVVVSCDGDDGVLVCDRDWEPNSVDDAGNPVRLFSTGGSVDDSDMKSKSIVCKQHHWTSEPQPCPQCVYDEKSKSVKVGQRWLTTGSKKPDEITITEIIGERAWFATKEGRGWLVFESLFKHYFLTDLSESVDGDAE